MVLGFLICIIGIFSPNRLSGLEIMFVIQYAFVSLLWLNRITLTSYSLNGLKYATGFNFNFEEIPETENPPQASLYQIDSTKFVNNFNICGTAYLLGIVGFIVTKIIYNKYEASHDV